MNLRRPRFVRTTITAAAASLFALPLEALPPRVGGEFRVNPITTFTQTRPEVASDAAGNFVAVWQDAGADGSVYGIYARRYSAAGQPLGIGDFQVNTGTTGNQLNPAVAMAADGRFVVVWQSVHENGAAESADGIYAQRYDADGIKQGAEFRVNVYTTGAQTQPSVGMEADGEFVVAWQSAGQDGSGEGIYTRLYRADGLPKSSEFRINNYTGGSQVAPAIAVAPEGEFVIAWTSVQDPDGSAGVYASARAGDGTTVAGEFRVNAYTTGSQSGASVASLAEGQFVIAWTSVGQKASGSGVFAQRYSNIGQTQGPEFSVPVRTDGIQANPRVAAQSDGRFAVVWETDSLEDINSGVAMRRYGADGSADGGEVRVNTYSTSTQSLPVIALDADGDAVVAWNSSGQDGSGFGIYAQRYGSDQPADIAVDQVDSADPAPAAGTLGYTLQVANQAPSLALTGVPAIDAAIGATSSLRLTDTLPAGSTLLDATGIDWQCTPMAGRVVCDYLQALAPGADASPLQINLTTPDVPGTTISNVARVTAAQADPNLANNRSAERTRLVCPPATVGFIFTPYSANESSGGVDLTVRRSGSDCGPVSVQVDTRGGTATPGLDYTDSSTVLNWADGDTDDRTVTVLFEDDLLDEATETLRARLSVPVGALLGDEVTVPVVIIDNDPTPRLNFATGGQSVAENGALVRVAVRLSQISGREVRVPLTFGGTAQAGADYFVTAGAGLTIPAGQLEASLELEIAGDTDDEPNETVILGMGAVGGATVGSINTHTITIADDDEPAGLPTVSFTTASSTGDEATPRSAVLTLSAPSAQAITVPLTITGTATQGGDYTLSRTSPITFNPGVTQLGIQVVPVDDSVDELNETAILTLGTPTGATLGGTTVHTRTIVDNDP